MGAITGCNLSTSRAFGSSSGHSTENPMRFTKITALLTIATFAIAFIHAQPAQACIDIKSSIVAATSEDPAVSTAAIKLLRMSGQGALDMLMEANADAIKKHSLNPKEKDPAWCRVASAIDAVAAQKDAWASGLYWFTDLEKAKTAAAAQKKPILSLRLLGTHDTEFSCANSRFFRTALYANADVSKYLKENYILHWQSVRPVPKVTIDFGDGRIVERTITGNSIHYVLDAQGSVIDGIPGLYGPTAFLKHLQIGRQALRQFEGKDAAFQEVTLARWHRNAANQILAEWSQDMTIVGAPMPVAKADPMRALMTANQAVQQPPPAIRAAPIAVGKSIAEFRLVRALTPTAEQLAGATDDAVWEKIAARHAEQAKLDNGSRVLIAAKQPDAVKAGLVARTKGRAEDPLVRIVRTFERSMSIDTVRNEYLLHRQIHRWLSESPKPLEVSALNERVYAELFLTPSSDPWLGLLPADAYSALENDGVRK
jgi:hypothetical protein